MKSKRKVLISMLVVSFVLLSIIATIAVVFALTQQTIKTTLNINYTAVDIDGTASAKYTFGGVTESLTAKKGNNVLENNILVFKAGDKEDAGNLLFPDDALALTSQNDNVIIEYTYSNTGSVHYIASMDFDANVIAKNIKIEYSINGTDYSEDRYAVVVPAYTSNKSYWIKISIDNKAKEAEFEGDFEWLLAACDEQEESYLSMPKLEFQGSEGSYSANIATNSEYVGNLVFPSEVNGDKVTKIVQNTNLTDAQKAQVKSVYIPDSVTTIGDSAFTNFANIETVTFEQNETAGASAQSGSGLKSFGIDSFKGCLSLKEIIIPNTVTSLGVRTFSHCSSLTNIDIPSSVTRIGNSTFNGCTSLTSIVLPNGMSKIEGYLFKGCSNLKNVQLPNALNSIETEAFRKCVALKSIEIPASVTIIKENAFRECSNLKEVNFAQDNSKLTTINTSAFYGTALEYLVIPENVTSIGSNAFYTSSLDTVVNKSALDIVVRSKGCGDIFNEYVDMIFTSEVTWTEETNTATGITYRIYRPKEGTNLTFNTADKNGYSQETFKVAISVVDNNKTTYTLDEDTDGIGYDVFKDNKNLNYIKIPASVKSIGYSAFRNCFGLSVVSNLSELNITNTAGATENYGCLNYYIGETYSEAVIVENYTNTTTNIKYLVVKKNGVQVDKIAMGIADTSVATSVVTLDADTTIVGYIAFRENTNITQVVLNDGLKRIAYNAFRDCSALATINAIPATVTDIGAKAFQGTAISAFTFANTTGWEYSSDGTTWAAVTSDIATYVKANLGKYYKNTNV